MRAGKKRYTLGLLLRSWFMSNFSKYDPCCNKQCAFGIRAPFYKGNKCLNRWNPLAGRPAKAAAAAAGGLIWL